MILPYFVLNSKRILAQSDGLEISITKNYSCKYKFFMLILEGAAQPVFLIHRYARKSQRLLPVKNNYRRNRIEEDQEDSFQLLSLSPVHVSSISDISDPLLPFRKPAGLPVFIFG